MADIKALGFDTTNAATKKASTNDTLEVDGSFTVVGNAEVGGNLTVTGTIFSTDEEQVLVKDNFIDLNFGQIGTTYDQAGITFNYQAVSGKVLSITPSGNNLTFSAAVASPAANPKIVAATASGIPSGTFADGDVIQVSGTANAENDGVYIVKANGVAGTLEIRNVGVSGDSINAAFASDDFTAATETGGTAVTIAKVNLMALRASSTGALEQQQGTTDGDFSSYNAVGGSQTLQDTYGNGATITTSGATAIDFNLADGNFTVDQGTFSLGTTTATNFQMNRGTFNVGVTNAVSEFIVSCDGNTGGDVLFSASDAAGSIQLEVNSNTILEAKDAALDLNTDVDFGKATGSAQVLKRTSVADGDDLTLQLTGANDASIIIDNVASTGLDAIKLDAQAGGFDIAGELDSKILVTTGDLSVGTFTSGDLTLSTTTAGAIIATSAENIDLNATGGVTIDGTAISIDGTSASNVSVTGANLSLETLTTGNVTVSSVGQLTLDSDDALFLKMDANDATNKTLQIQANNAGGGQANIDIDADNNIFCKIAGTPVLEIAPSSIIASQNLQASSSGGLRFGLAGQVVTEIDTDDTFGSATDSALATQLAIKTYVDNQIPTVDEDLNIQGDTGTGTVNLNTQNLDVAGGTNITTVASGTTITANLDADITLTSVTATTLATSNLKANDGTAAITIADTTGAVAVSKATTFSANATITGQNAIVVDAANGATVVTENDLSILDGVSQFDLVHISGTGYDQADASAIGTAFVVGVAGETASGSDVANGQVTLFGTAVVDIPTGTPAVGDRVYLSETAGKATLSAPTTPGSVVYQVGFVTHATAVAGTAFPIVFQPQFIIQN